MARLAGGSCWQPAAKRLGQMLATRDRLSLARARHDTSSPVSAGRRGARSRGRRRRERRPHGPVRAQAAIDSKTLALLAQAAPRGTRISPGPGPATLDAGLHPGLLGVLRGLGVERIGRCWAGRRCEGRVGAYRVHNGMTRRVAWVVGRSAGLFGGSSRLRAAQRGRGWCGKKPACPTSGHTARPCRPPHSGWA